MMCEKHGESGLILMRTILSGWISVIPGVARVTTSGYTGFCW